MNIDGVEIFVEKLPGTGDLNFVLIHNAGSDHRFFTHQIDMLRQFGLCRLVGFAWLWQKLSDI